MRNLEEKVQAVREILKSKGKVLVCFSGGVDSTLLSFLAKETLGENAKFILISSPLHPEEELEEAHRVASLIGISISQIEMNELLNEEFAVNSRDRCYVCKRMRFSKIKPVAEEMEAVICEGSNYDDLNDFRPGLKVLKELGILSPFIEVGMKKDEIRTLAQKYHLPNWDKPPAACLATRIPFGIRIDLETLKRIERAEKALKALGFKHLRARLHGDLLRLEVPEEDMEKILLKRKHLLETLKSLGFSFLTLDLEPYRPSGLSFKKNDEFKGGSFSS
jgi:uncharacterized protein